MKTHELKCWPQFFSAVACGLKQFEFRKDDRGFEVGDLLFLREFDAKNDSYSGGAVRARVNYIARSSTFSAIPEGWCIMSIEVTDFYGKPQVARKGEETK